MQNKCGVTGKTQYVDRREARTALAKLAVRRAGHKTECTYYRCKHCSKWHLSSMADKNRERVLRMAPASRWRYRDEEE